MPMKAHSKIPRQKIVGIEFLKLTHWERYLLNEYLANLEKVIFPEKFSDATPNIDTELWRGNRRVHYRVETQALAIQIELDFRPIMLKIFTAKILNISPDGCLLLLPPSEQLDIGTRIPRIRLELDSETIISRGQVVFCKDYE